jgi:hypothetical protein
VPEENIDLAVDPLNCDDSLAGDSAAKEELAECGLECRFASRDDPKKLSPAVS